MADFFSSLLFWQLEPNQTALTIRNDDDLVLAVLASEKREILG